MFFHPDLLQGTSLGKKMKNYSFFSYEVSEALHMSEREREIIINCFREIREELQHSIDKHSRDIITSNIEVFLNHCVRFYDRQFATRKDVNNDILSRFEELLFNYFSSDKSQLYGLPTVSFCADQLHLSANYFGDLIKKETGKSAQEYIQFSVINKAKDCLSTGTGKSVSEIAYELGFKYPHHLSRIYKKLVGCTPNEYRNSLVFFCDIKTLVSTLDVLKVRKIKNGKLEYNIRKIAKFETEDRIWDNYGYLFYDCTKKRGISFEK